MTLRKVFGDLDFSSSLKIESEELLFKFNLLKKELYQNGTFGNVHLCLKIQPCNILYQNSFLELELHPISRNFIRRHFLVCLLEDLLENVINFVSV